MTKKVRFGPAGNPIDYKGKTPEVCDYLASEGLDAYEYQATYGVRISKKPAQELQENAKKNKVLISMHAPYYVNLSSSDSKVIDRSIQRLVQSAQVAEWMGAYRIVFHPGFYTKYTPEIALEKCKQSIAQILEQLNEKGIKNFIFSPETSGKKSQLGSLEEIINLCQTFENFQPTIDFAHLHARSGGSINSREDYQKIVDELDQELDINHLHCHFARIEFGSSGERKHHKLSQKEYGPPVKPLLQILMESGWSSTIICETPLIDRDALKLKNCFYEIVNI